MTKDKVQDIRSLDAEVLKHYILCKGDEQSALFSMAREVRDTSSFGKRVELRSVIEISNRCRQACRYCTMGKDDAVKPFALNSDQILENLERLATLGRRTFLVQSGENADSGFLGDVERTCSIFTKKYPDACLILNLGNLELDDYIRLRKSGAKRYLLKFETGRADHYHYCKPKDELESRLACLDNLFTAGFQVGTGNIVGLPKQTLDDLVNDLRLTMRWPLSMVSATKFIPNERSEFKDAKPGDIDMTLNCLALLRILHPDCLIPSTSSLAIGTTSGQLMGLMAGCNTVTIHDGTDESFKGDYPIYSDNRFTPGEQYCRDLIKNADMIPEAYLI